MDEFPLAHANGILIGFAVVVALFVLFAAVEMAEVIRRTRDENAALEEYLRRCQSAPPSVDTSSLLDDSPQGPLPESWRAPCGEVVRFPDTPSDRGPKAA